MPPITDHLIDGILHDIRDGVKTGKPLSSASLYALLEPRDLESGPDSVEAVLRGLRLRLASAWHEIALRGRSARSAYINRRPPLNPPLLRALCNFQPNNASTARVLSGQCPTHSGLAGSPWHLTGPPLAGLPFCTPTPQGPPGSPVLVACYRTLA